MKIEFYFYFSVLSYALSLVHPQPQQESLLLYYITHIRTKYLNRPKQGRQFWFEEIEVEDDDTDDENNERDDNEFHELDRQISTCGTSELCYVWRRQGRYDGVGRAQKYVWLPLSREWVHCTTQNIIIENIFKVFNNFC